MRRAVFDDAVLANVTGEQFSVSWRRRSPARGA